MTLLVLPHLNWPHLASSSRTLLKEMPAQPSASARGNGNAVPDLFLETAVSERIRMNHYLGIELDSTASPDTASDS